MVNAKAKGIGNRRTSFEHDFVEDFDERTLHKLPRLRESLSVPVGVRVGLVQPTATLLAQVKYKHRWQRVNQSISQHI